LLAKLLSEFYVSEPQYCYACFLADNNQHRLSTLHIGTVCVLAALAKTLEVKGKDLIIEREEVTV
jgi:hypothetical protein